MPIQSAHRFTVSDYYRMGETGMLRPDARVELLDGKIIDMSPIGLPHAAVVKNLVHFFRLLDRDQCVFSIQDPLRLDDRSEPQPDLMLLKPSANFYASHPPRPDDVFLLVEVSDSTLEFDREEKLPRYGRAGITEVWIANLIDSTVEVYREPHFTGYGSVTILQACDKASPAAFPEITVNVASVFKR